MVAAVKDVCTGGTEIMHWVKTNIEAQSMQRMTLTIDYICIGHYTSDDDNVPCLFAGGPLNTQVQKSGGVLDVLHEAVVFHKLRFMDDDKKVVNIYHKPLKLLKRLVLLYSERGD